MNLAFQVERHLSQECRSNHIQCPFKHVGCQYQVSASWFFFFLSTLKEKYASTSRGLGKGLSGNRCKARENVQTVETAGRKGADLEYESDWLTKRSIVM